MPIEPAELSRFVVLRENLMASRLVQNRETLQGLGISVLPGTRCQLDPLADPGQAGFPHGTECPAPAGQLEPRG